MVPTVCPEVGENLDGLSSAPGDDASCLTAVDRLQDRRLGGKSVAMGPACEPFYVSGLEDDMGLAMILELAAQVLPPSR